MRSFALVGMLAAATTLPVQAQVAYELDGSLWSRLESRTIDQGANSNFTWLQTRIGAEMTFSPLVRVFAQVQDTRRLGRKRAPVTEVRSGWTCTRAISTSVTGQRHPYG